MKIVCAFGLVLKVTFCCLLVFLHCYLKSVFLTSEGMKTKQHFLCCVVYLWKGPFLSHGALLTTIPHIQLLWMYTPTEHYFHTVRTISERDSHFEWLILQWIEYETAKLGNRLNLIRKSTIPLKWHDYITDFWTVFMFFVSSQPYMSPYLRQPFMLPRQLEEWEIMLSLDCNYRFCNEPILNQRTDL